MQNLRSPRHPRFNSGLGSRHKKLPPADRPPGARYAGSATGRRKRLAQFGTCDLSRFTLCIRDAGVGWNCQRSIVYQVSDGPSFGGFPSPLIPCTARPEPHQRPGTDQGQVQKEHNYDSEHRKVSVPRFPPTDSHETNASCGCGRFSAKPVKEGQGGSIPGGHQHEGVRNLALARAKARL